MNTEKILELIIDTEKKASKIMMNVSSVTAETKTDRRNVVTQFDTEIQNMMVTAISKEIPDSHFFCEESSNPDSLDAENVFIIDPIDGTMNFVHGLNSSCISCAYMSNGAIEAAAVYNPYMDEMFSAMRGNGAFLNGRKITVDDAGLNEVIALLGTSPYYPDKTDGTFRIARLLYDNCLDLRRSGSAEIDLCSVAAGRGGIFYEEMLSFWDYAAGGLIAAEAGAKVLTPDGNSLPMDGRKSGVVCAGPKTMEEFFKL